MADKSLNNNDLVAAVAAESGQSQAAVNGVLDALFSTLAKSVADGTKVTIPGWLAVEHTTAPRAQAATRRRARPSRSPPQRRQGLRRQQAQGRRQVILLTHTPSGAPTRGRRPSVAFPGGDPAASRPSAGGG